MESKLEKIQQGIDELTQEQKEHQLQELEAIKAKLKTLDELQQTGKNIPKRQLKELWELLK